VGASLRVQGQRRRGHAHLVWVRRRTRRERQRGGHHEDDQDAVMPRSLGNAGRPGHRAGLDMRRPAPAWMLGGSADRAALSAPNGGPRHSPVTPAPGASLQVQNRSPGSWQSRDRGWLRKFLNHLEDAS
jgi:hypothetical protein